MDVCWNAGIPAPNSMAHTPSNSTLNGYRLPTGADLTGRQHHLRDVVGTMSVDRQRGEFGVGQAW